MLSAAHTRNRRDCSWALFTGFVALHRSSGGLVLGEPLEASHGHCPPQLVAWSPAES